MSWRDTMFYGLKLTEEQAIYADSIERSRMTIAEAKSGTGKTTVAVGMAKIIGKPLLYVFNPTEEDKMGFRPGEQEDKEEVYLQPLKDALLAIGENPMQAIRPKAKDEHKQKFSSHAWVEAESHIFRRGTNIKGYTIIIDEAQNWTKHDLKKLLTRIHDDCTVIVIGHTGQIDLKNPKLSGFSRVIEHFSTKWYCRVVKLTKNFRGELSQDADEL